MQGTVEAWAGWKPWSTTVQENARNRARSARNSARSARKSAKMSMNLCSAVRSHIIGAERDYFVKGKSMDGLRHDS